MWFASILLRSVCTYAYQGHWPEVFFFFFFIFFFFFLFFFFFCRVFVWFWYQDNAGLVECIWKLCFTSILFWNSLRKVVINSPLNSLSGILCISISFSSFSEDQLFLLECFPVFSPFCLTFCSFNFYRLARTATSLNLKEWSFVWLYPM